MFGSGRTINKEQLQGPWASTRATGLSRSLQLPDNVLIVANRVSVRRLKLRRTLVGYFGITSLCDNYMTMCYITKMAI